MQKLHCANKQNYFRFTFNASIEYQNKCYQSGLGDFQLVVLFDLLLI